MVGNGTRNFKCQKCGRCFKRKSHLKEHETKHSGVEYECTTCNKKFRWKKNLVEHSKLHAKVQEFQKCTKCGKRFSQKSKLVQHTTAVHNGVKKHQCEQCGQTFSYSSGLWRHIHKSKGLCIQMKSIEVQQNAPGNVTTLKCFKCGSEPGFKSNLVDQFTPQNMGMRYVCPKCDENLESADNLEDYFKGFVCLVDE